MVKSNQAFKPSRKTSQVVLLILCIGLGWSQLIMSPPLGDPMSSITESPYDISTYPYSENLQNSNSYCIETRGDQRSVSFIINRTDGSGGGLVIRDLSEVSALNFRMGNLSDHWNRGRQCFASHFFEASRKVILGCQELSNGNMAGYWIIESLQSMPGTIPETQLNPQQDLYRRLVTKNAQDQTVVLNKVLSITPVPPESGQVTSIGFIDENRKLYMCGPQVEVVANQPPNHLCSQLQYDYQTVTNYSQVEWMQYWNLTPHCAAAGKTNSVFSIFLFECSSSNYSTPLTAAYSSTLSFESSKPMSFTMLRRNTTPAHLLAYGRDNNAGVDYIMSHSQGQSTLPPRLFRQSSHFFSENEIKLQTSGEVDSLVLVLNGSTSLTLLNWVYSLEIQTWRAGSAIPQLSGCLSGDNIFVVIRRIPGQADNITLRQFKLNSNCTESNARYCRENDTAISACNSGTQLQPPAQVIINPSNPVPESYSCTAGCPPSHITFLAETCPACHPTCGNSCQNGKMNPLPSLTHLAQQTCSGECNEGFYFIPGGIRLLSHSQRLLPQHYNTGNGICNPCPVNCARCADISSCNRCMAGFYMDLTYSNQCTDEQSKPDGYFYNWNLRIVQKCHPTCKTCDGPFQTSCLSCESPRTLDHVRKMCRPCEDGFYTNLEGYCMKCNDACLTCFDGTDSGCLSCHSGKFLKFNQCVESCGNSGVPGGTIPLQNYCSYCWNTEIREDGTCKAQSTGCSSNKILDPTTKICCGGCLRCYSPDYGKCSACPVGSYLQSDDTCQSCPSGCASCFGHSQNWMCLSCAGTKKFFGGQCLDNCPAGTIANSANICVTPQAVPNCHSSCLTCSGPNSTQCLSCPLNSDQSLRTYLHNNQCLLNCPVQTFKLEANQTCAPCHVSCLNCTGNHTF